MNSESQSEIYKRAKSFRYAFEGCWYVLRSQKNAWIHTAFTIAVILIGLWLSLPKRDWAILILTMAFVWAVEFINTAIEALVDMVMPTPNPLAKIAKDVSAGSVLIVAFAAVVIGLLILGPPLWTAIFP